jgi:hypothetical protein
VVEEDRTAREVDLEEAEAGQVGASLQASLALEQLRFVALTGEGVGQDPRSVLQPLHEVLGPVALHVQRVEGHRADGGVATHGKRERQVRQARAQRSPVDGEILGHLVHRTNRHDATGHHLADDPRVEILLEGLGLWEHSERIVDMGGPDDRRDCIRPLPQHGEIDAERLADAAQPLLDFAVNLPRLEADELRRKV